MSQKHNWKLTAIGLAFFNNLWDPHIINKVIEEPIGIGMDEGLFVSMVS